MSLPRVLIPLNAPKEIALEPPDQSGLQTPYSPEHVGPSFPHRRSTDGLDSAPIPSARIHLAYIPYQTGD